MDLNLLKQKPFYLDDEQLSWVKSTLENMSEDYKIVRIVSNYIHNNEQFEFDIVKTKQLTKAIRKKRTSNETRH